MWLVAGSRLRTCRHTIENIVLMTSCASRCRSEVSAHGKLLRTIRRWFGLQTTWLRGSSRYPSGCNLFGDAAACASRDRSVRARPLLAVLVHAGGGRCLRRSRAPRARRAQPQCVWDGHGVYCGRSGGGRVLAGGIYSRFRVVLFSFAF